MTKQYESAKSDLARARHLHQEEVQAITNKLNAQHNDALAARMRVAAEEVATRVDKLSAQLTHAQLALSTAHEETKECEQKLMVTRAQVAELLKERDALRAHVATADTRSSAFSEHVQQLQRELSQLLAQVRTLQADLRSVSEERDNSVKLVRHFRTHIESAGGLARHEANAIEEVRACVAAAHAQARTIEDLHRLKVAALEETIASAARERQIDERRSMLRMQTMRLQKGEVEVRRTSTNIYQ